jgi:hypothetical protein
MPSPNPIVDSGSLNIHLTTLKECVVGNTRVPLRGLPILIDEKLAAFLGQFPTEELQGEIKE